jgi:uncharacterized phage infection (PIP) family protein YhgE
MKQTARHRASGAPGELVIGSEAVQKVLRALVKARAELESLAHGAESEIQSLTAGFEELATQSNTILRLASAIVGCIEDEGVRSVLPKVQNLGAAARRYVEARLQATNGILETVTTEVKLLRQLSTVAHNQSAIALRTRVLTMLTNIEVGRLGAAGTGFHNLATELAAFSRSLTEDTEELARHTDARRPAIEAAKRVLSAELPHLVDEFARIDLNLGDDLAALESRLTQLSEIPTQFRKSVEEIAVQISGVVAAIQSHDITRQQIEHVQEAFTLISSRMHSEEGSKHDILHEGSLAYAGITIQISQLQNIKASVANWTSQIRTCMEVILRVGASDLVGISPLVLEQEREISSKLAHIELLECEGRGYSAKIRRTVGGHASLLQLVGQHVERSKAVRQLLHLLSLNSIIEADRLGTRANAILEIGNGISDLSAEWSKITDRSEDAMREILKLANQTGELMETFSEAGDETLREAQIQTRTGLDSLRAAAAFAAGQAQEIQLATRTMQAMSAGIGKSGDLLDASYGHIDAILADIQSVQRQLESDCPGVKDGYDIAEMDQLFAASYTTEVEREVLHAALHGTPLPPMQQALGGNSIELF